MANHNRVWASTGAVTEPDAGEVENGWGTIVPPRHDWQNWFMNLVATTLQQIQRNGVMEWDPAVPYDRGVMVTYNGSYYHSLVATTGNQPDISVGTWLPSISGSILGYVDAEINEVRGGVVSTMDTLSEIAGSLNNDPNFYATMLSLLAGKSDTGHTHDASTLNANSVGQSEIAAGAVHQGELATATAAGSIAIPGSTDVSYALTGGTYSWWTASATANRVPAFGAGDQPAGVIGIHNSGIAGTLYIDERYISASPPYNLGDGDVPLFIHLLIDSNSNIVGKNIAPDPTWAYHGDHIITPQRICKVTGKQYRVERIIEGTGLTLRQAISQKSKAYDDYIAGRKSLVTEEIEITCEYKNSDMEIHSNPWCQNDASFFADKTAVLVDPVGPMIEQLAEMSQELGPRHIMQLIEDDYLRVDSTEINRASPLELKVHQLKWRNSANR